MFESLSRSWTFAKASYGLVWKNKRMLIFPIVSGVAALLVLGSFLVPLHSTGALAVWSEAATGSEEEAMPVAAWITLFAYYVVNFFVIVFFNSALVVCAMRHMQGQPVRIGDGLAAAARRWHAILCWAIVSAVVGVLLRALESNRKTGQIVSGLIGMAWTVMTYFVVPVIVVDNRGPIQAIRDSAAALKRTWGTALAGNFSLGLVNFLLFIPVLIAAVALGAVGVMSGSLPATLLAFAAAALLIILFACLSSAAGTVFKTILFSYATGKGLPDDMAPQALESAFRSKQDR